MDNKLIMFNNQEFGQVRMVEIDNKPYAVGIDVAKALEYAKPSQAIIDHCKGIRKLGIPSNGGIQETNVIPEGDIFRLIVKAADQSKNSKIKEKAEKFESWVFDEVLPAIRQTGVYQYNQKIEQLEATLDKFERLTEEAKQQYKPSHKRKLDYNKMIKTLTNNEEEVQVVKDWVFGLLNIEKWEDTCVDDSKKIIETITTVARLLTIKKFEQLSLF